MIDQSQCPRPDKIAFTTRQKAKQWLKRIRPSHEVKVDTSGTTSYRCQCGLFHVGRR